MKKIIFIFAFLLLMIPVQSQAALKAVVSGSATQISVPGYDGSTTIGNAITGYDGTLNVSMCANTFKPSWCSGSDIGAWINAAITYANSQGYLYPKIIVDPRQTYAITTTVTVPKDVTLDFQGAKLTRAATDGVAFVLGGTQCCVSGGGIYNLNLVGSGSGSGSDIAFYAGGDPAGVISPTNNFYSANMRLIGVSVSGFRTVFTYGNNAWGISIVDSFLTNNYDAIVVPSTPPTNSGEHMLALRTRISNNTNCAFNFGHYNAADWIVSHGWIDYNAYAVCGKANILLVENHIEQTHGPIINLTGSYSWVMARGGSWSITASSGTDNGWIYSDNAANTISLSGIELYQYNATNYLVYTGGLTTPIKLQYQDLLDKYSPGFTSNWRAVTDAPGITSGNTLQSGWKYERGDIALTADGTYQIAATTGKLAGTYILRWTGSSRESRYIVDVATNTYDQAAVTVRNAYDYSGQVVLSNFRVVGNADGSARYFVVDVANRNSSTGYLNVTAYGADINLNLSATPGGSTAITNYANYLGGRTGLNGIGTQSPQAGLHNARGKFLVTGGTAPSISSCGTSPTITGADSSFVLTMGSGVLTSCVVNFGSTWLTAPSVCELTAMNSTAAAVGTTGSYVSAISTTQLTITGLNLTSAKYGVHCH